MSNASTIFALSSGPGRAGVAVIRVSGPAVQTVLASLAAPLPEVRKVAFRTLRDRAGGEPIDQAVVFWCRAPASETGEDVAELQCHGSRAVVGALLAALGSIPGCRLAEPGEFARRAFQNGKLDLAQVEGLADLIDAETEAQRRQALSQASGHLSAIYEAWRSRLIEIAALTEAAIDFADEGDVGTASLAQARERAQGLDSEIGTHLADGHRGEIVRQGYRVALLGPPNAGKSSLLNALARREAAIVSEEAGTTRDVIEVRLDLDGYAVIVSDTAGIRDSDGLVEREGIRRSLVAAKQADLVIWLSESGEPPPPEISRETILDVRSKSDLDSRGAGGLSRGAGGLAISSRTGAGLAELTGLIAKRCRDAVGVGGYPVLTQERHRQAVEAARQALADFIAGDGGDVELRADDIRRATTAIGRITGRVDVEDVLRQIFSRFCIGK